MSFGHPFLLLFAVIPFVWVAYAWRSSRRHLSLLLKAMSFAAILVAFAEPVITLPETKTGTVILADTSLSIAPGDLSRESSIAYRIERGKGRNWVKVVPFASSARALQANEITSGLHLVHAGDLSGTNLEAALTASMAAIPSGHIPRLVLISDGNENQGSSARAIAELERLHVPVDTVPLNGRSGTGFHLEYVSMPHQAYMGEQIPIDLGIDSPGQARATVRLSAEGRELGESAIELKAGANSVRVNARVKSSGITSVSGRIHAEGFGDLQFEQAIQLKRARILYLSQDPPGTESNLMDVFTQAELDLVRSPAALENDLSGFQLVVLNNLDLNSLSSAAKDRIEEYVKSGGGLLLIGGERQLYKQERQMDALDRALPAKLAPPETPRGTCVAIIIDKSSSMEGRKIELARLSAIGVVDHLHPADTIGVLIFDNSYQWAVPVRKAEDKSLIKRLISGITPDGGTQIAPALAEAYRKVLPSKATYKHIVLLTDGISEEGDSIELAREAANHEVTISTVGLGQDVNRSYLEKVALTSGGKSYFLNEPQGLEQILLKDVEDYSGATSVEKSLTPIIQRTSEVLDGVAMDSAPALKGYSRFTAKPGAETILAIDPQKKDPLYVLWQYGLGRAAVFTSDAKSRWAEAWMSWPGFDKFWINVVRDLLSHTGQSEASADFDAANGDVVVNYRLANGAVEPERIPEIFVMGPNTFAKPVSVQKIAPRWYEGRLHVGQVTGLFRIRPLQESNAFPEVGLYRQNPEMEDYGSSEDVLKQISANTGGRFDPPLDAIFDTGGRSLYSAFQLWPGLLGLAIALTIAELVVRKWGGLLQGLRIVR